MNTSKHESCANHTKATEVSPSKWDNSVYVYVIGSLKLSLELCTGGILACFKAA